MAYFLETQCMYVSIACPGGTSDGDERMKYVNAYNIDSFKGCGTINGYLSFLNMTLHGSVRFLTGASFALKHVGQ